MNCLSKYALNKASYTWENALLWGNFREHCKEVSKGSLSHRIVHFIISLALCGPIFCQIGSIFEKIILTQCLYKKQGPKDLLKKNISQGIPLIAQKMPILNKIKEEAPVDEVPPKEVLGVEKVQEEISSDEKSELKILMGKSFYKPEEGEDIYTFRAGIFNDTLKACENGYKTSNHIEVRLNHEPMLQNTVSYNQVDALIPMEKTFKTAFSVMIEDTFQVLLRRAKEGFNPVGINMANRFHPGGGVESGCPAQEEALCRRSNHYLGLKTQAYPLAEEGGIYCPHVQIFRNSEAEGYSLMDQPQEVALVAVAAYDLRDKSSDRQNLELPLTGTLDQASLESSIKFMNGSKSKIRQMLRIMSSKGHTHLVLGALGCGAFQNPPTLISKLFLEAFNETEFKGRFETVDFAILKIFPNDDKNVEAFSQVCETLNGSKRMVVSRIREASR